MVSRRGWEHSSEGWKVGHLENHTRTYWNDVSQEASEISYWDECVPLPSTLTLGTMISLSLIWMMGPSLPLSPDLYSRLISLWTGRSLFQVPHPMTLQG
jgi:hypothetical protein